MRVGRISSLAIWAAASFIALGAVKAIASTVNYSGTILDPVGPASDDFVIAGTFKPGFDEYNFFGTYGDPWGNVLFNFYTRAVNDGNFRPIGTGTTASASGAFSGTGDTIGIDGLPIYVWAFESANPDNTIYFALATGSGAAWKVTGGGSTTIVASTADQYIFGSAGPSGTTMLESGPIPEPTTAPLALLASVARRRQRRR